MLLSRHSGAKEQDEKFRGQEISASKENPLRKLLTTDLYDVGWWRTAPFNSISTNTRPSGRTAYANVNVGAQGHQDKQGSKNEEVDSNWQDGGH